MYYIKKDGNLEQKFKVIVDTKKLKALLVLLDEECYVRRFGKKHYSDGAFNERGAIEVLDNEVNNANQKVNEAYKVEGLCEGLYWHPGLPYDIKYEAIYKDSVYLVTIIKKILNSVRRNADITMILNELENYQNSDDFVSFDVRSEKALMDFQAKLLANNPNVIEAIHAYIDRNIEAKLNENFNFNKLYAIYLEVKKCINYNLVEEKYTYKTR